MANIEQESKDRCAAIIAAQPAIYQPYIHILTRRKNIGTKDRPQWVVLSEPYMGVDGRIKAITSEHHETGRILNITTEFVTVGDKMLCRAKVNSEAFGEVTAHAVVNLGGPGVDQTNPFENAETSAIGRALGFMGYGILGTGIASAEEVVQAQAQALPESPRRAPQSGILAGERGTAAARAQLLNACLQSARDHGMDTKGYHQYAWDTFAASPSDLSVSQLEQLQAALMEIGKENP